MTKGKSSKIAYDPSWLGVSENYPDDWVQRREDDPHLRLMRNFIDAFKIKVAVNGFWDWTQDDGETAAEWHDYAIEHLYEARAVYYDQRGRDYHAQRGAEIKERLDGGRMSICPYFWSVVIAVLVYCGIVCPWRWFWSTLARPLEFAAVATMGIAMVGGIGYGLWSGRHAFVNAGRGIVGMVIAIPTVPDRVGDWVYEWNRERKEEAVREDLKAKLEASHRWQNEQWMEQRERENARRQAEAKRSRIDWERTHPEEVRLRKEADEAQAMMWRARDAKDTIKSIKSWDRFLLMVLGVVVIFAVVVLYSGRFVDIILALFSYLVFVRFDKQGQRVFERLEALVGRWRRRYEAWRRFWRDTGDLVSAFVKATKERVCPFLTIVDEEN